MMSQVQPIAAEERVRRLEHAQVLMRAAGIDAILVEPGSSMIYFTGVDWYRSERLTAALIPAAGDVIVVTPSFEAPSVAETLAIAADIRDWDEDEDPLLLLGSALRELSAVTLGVEESVRFFVLDGLRLAAPDVRPVSAAPVVSSCRMTKSPAEIGLMQRAAEITMAAYHETWPQIAGGMTPDEIGTLMNEAMRALGGKPEFALILLGEASAYPHGSSRPQQVCDGEIVLMDCGCSVHGYRSDISRTFVFGEANAAQRRIWDQVRNGQRVAIEAARIGASVGSVDGAVRREYRRLGYAPHFGAPGLVHRTGHGIGLDGHEPPYLVGGDATPLASGMCFSNEPGLYFPGQFGIRIEDCFFMTDEGPCWFTDPPSSIDEPLG